MMLYAENNHIKSLGPFDEGICKNNVRTKNQWMCITESIINGKCTIYSQINVSEAIQVQ